MLELDFTRRDFLSMSTMFAAMLSACGAETREGEVAGTEQVPAETQDSGVGRERFIDEQSESHAIAVSGESASYVGVDVVKTGDAEGDEADFYGTNAAVYAEEGAALTLEDITVTCDGTHANAVFSYGENTNVTISDSKIETTSDCSGGIMVTGGATIVARNLDIHTTGDSSAAIRSDRGGGVEDVSGGRYVTEGVGSPAIYSTAEVTVRDASLTSMASQGVVVEGRNSVCLEGCTLDARNTTKRSDKSDYFQAVMIYQSMSGDAQEGKASFTMRSGTLDNISGDVFFVNNTVADIELSGVKVINEDTSGCLLRACAAGWGNEGENGGHVTLTLEDQEVAGDIITDEISEVNCYLKGSSALVGAVNPQNAGKVYVELASGATWELSQDSFVDGLTCDEDAIVLKGNVLTVGGVAYEEGTVHTGEAIEFDLPTAGGTPGEPPAKPAEGAGPMGEGEPPAKPGEDAGPMGGGKPPAKPGEGEGPMGAGSPPAKPEGDMAPTGEAPVDQPQA